MSDCGENPPSYNNPENAKRIEAFKAFCSSRIGKVRYGYVDLVRLAVIKVFQIRLTRREDRDMSPNDLPTYPELNLVFVV